MLVRVTAPYVSVVKAGEQVRSPALRGQVVDASDDDALRFLEAGAVVDADDPIVPVDKTARREDPPKVPARGRTTRTQRRAADNGG